MESHTFLNFRQVLLNYCLYCCSLALVFFFVGTPVGHRLRCSLPSFCIWCLLFSPFHLTLFLFWKSFFSLSVSVEVSSITLAAHVPSALDFILNWFILCLIIFCVPLPHFLVFSILIHNVLFISCIIFMNDFRIWNIRFEFLPFLVWARWAWFLAIFHH